MFHCVYKGFTGCYFLPKIVWPSLKIHFVLAHSAEPDEMQYYICGISSVSSLFAEVTIYGFPALEGSTLKIIANSECYGES